MPDSESPTPRSVAPRFEDSEAHAAAVREAVLRAADPAAALERAWSREPAHALLSQAGRVRVLAIGKAGVPMAREAARLLGGGAGGAGAGAARGCAGLVVTSPHPDAASAARATGFEVLEADHPIATSRNVAAARRVEAFARATAPDELLLVLMSGGGSALLASPAGSLTLDDLTDATRRLLRAGAPIRELNCVRKHCERLKGGRLARLVGVGHAPARPRVVAFVVSDVLGDPLDVISSGPLAPDPTTYAEALAVLERRGVAGSAPTVVAHLRAGASGEFDETPKPGDAAFEGVVSTVIASNQVAAVAARDALLRVGFAVKVVCRVEGEAGAIGRGLVGDAIAESAAADASFAVVYAGETTVDVGDATGLGGRNQELALAAGIELEGLAHLGARVCVATLATDGIDGPTDTAGAVVDSHTGALARERGVDLGGALARHDSHAALGALGLLVRTGPTGTNVNDVAVAMVYGTQP